MKTSIDDVRNFLMANGLHKTINMLEVEYQLDPGSPRLPSEQHNPVEGHNQALNLSFGENDSTQPKDSLVLDSHASMRNNVDMHFETVHSHSPNVSTHSMKRHAEPPTFAKSENLPGPQKESKNENPFGPVEVDPIADKKKSLISGGEEEKFSFRAEAEDDGDDVPENDFDSFSKSHNNKFSKNENDDPDDGNAFGNSFDINPDTSGQKGKSNKGGIIDHHKGENLFLGDDIERAKSEVNAPDDDVPRQKAKMDLLKSDVKSIDNDVIMGHDVRTLAAKRASQGFNVFANSRGLSKQLFPGMDSEDIFEPIKSRGGIPMRKSDGYRQQGGKQGQIKPEFNDGGELTSYRTVPSFDL